MVHDFSDSMHLEETASPLLDRWYRNNFKNLLDIIDVTKERFFQSVGIDKFLVFRCPNVAKIVHFSVDEKARNKAYDDLLAETWSQKEKEIPGWVWTCKADYIVYAFVVNGELAESPRIIPTVDFVSSINTKEYRENKTRTQTQGEEWETVFKLIPKEDLPSKPPHKLRLEDFM
jgi:hypothetical protein